MNRRLLIYDDHCPMCHWYAALFVRTGLLAPEDRKAFSELDPRLLQAIDYDRGRHEFPCSIPAPGRHGMGLMHCWSCWEKNGT